MLAPRTDAEMFHPYQYDRFSRPLLRIMGVRSDRDGVRIDADRLIASFGPLNTHTALVNIKAVSITGPYAWLKAVGPRLSLADHGLTFGTNAEAGVCVLFHEPIPRVIGPWDHPGLTVTVTDPTRFAQILTAQVDAA